MDALSTKNFKRANIIKRVWPQICGVKAEESSLGGETKDRMYVIVWDEKFVKILGKRKR